MRPAAAGVVGFPWLAVCCLLVRRGVEQEVESELSW